MNDASRALLTLIRESVLLERHQTHYDDVTLADGQPCKFGSPEHVKSLESVIAELENLKKHWKYRTLERKLIADTGSLLKRVRDRCVNNAEPVQLKKDEASPEDVGSLVDADDPMDTGRTGYGRGAPAHGRYVPGIGDR